MAGLLELTRCGSSSEADWPTAGALPRNANRAFTGTRLRFPHCFESKAESVMRASYVNESNNLRERASEMRASSRDLKDNNTAATIMRLADLYDRLADRAEARADRAVLTDDTKEDGPPTRS
jgi:hypothetical protein